MMPQVILGFLPHKESHVMNHYPKPHNSYVQVDAVCRELIPFSCGDQNELL